LAYSFNPTNGVLSLVVGIPSTPTNITCIVSAGNIILSWPGYLGWILQEQTNSIGVGLTTNWVNVAGSAAYTSVTFPINRADGSMFFRLIHP
jgi:hypothetical protein